MDSIYRRQTMLKKNDKLCKSYLKVVEPIIGPVVVIQNYVVRNPDLLFLLKI